MRNRLLLLLEKYRQMTAGSYGMDEFTKALLIGGIVLDLLSLIPYFWFFRWIGLLLLGYGLYRFFSKKKGSRHAERIAYLKTRDGVKRFFANRKRVFTERKDYDFFQCTNCKAYVRIKKGHPKKIMITCSKCRTEFGSEWNRVYL